MNKSDAEIKLKDAKIIFGNFREEKFSISISKEFATAWETDRLDWKNEALKQMQRQLTCAYKENWYIKCLDWTEDKNYFYLIVWVHHS